MGVPGRQFGLSGRKQENGEDCIVRRFMIFTCHKILLGDQFKQSETRGAFDTHGR
jgi:hypothetical protein